MHMLGIFCPELNGDVIGLAFVRPLLDSHLQGILLMTVLVLEYAVPGAFRIKLSATTLTNPKTLST